MCGLAGSEEMQQKGGGKCAARQMEEVEEVGEVKKVERSKRSRTAKQRKDEKGESRGVVLDEDVPEPGLRPKEA